MPYGTDPEATPEQLQKLRGAQPATGGYGKDPIWRGVKDAAPKTQEPPAEKPGVGAALWEGLKRGARDVLESGASIGAKMMQAGPEEGAGAFDNPAQRQAMAGRVAPALHQSAAQYAQSPARIAHPYAAGLSRLGGNIAAAAPLAAIPGASGAGMGLAGRALLGAGMAAATGGGPGAVAGGMTGVLGGMIGPALNPAFQKIAQQFPNLAQMATGALGRTAESFQRATANEVLQPIGQMVDRSVKIGHDLVNAVDDKLEQAYNTVLPKVTFRATEVDPASGQSFASGLKSLAENVPEAHAKDFERLVRRQISNRLDEGGNMSGEAFKRADHEIGRLARRHSSFGATTDAQEYADVLRNLQANMRDTLALHNPQQAQNLRTIDQAWARYVRMQEAAGRRVDSNGEFMPNDLLMASRKGAGNRAFSQGDLLMQSFGRAGNDLLAGRPPQFDRYLADIMGAGVGGALGAGVGGPIGGGLGAAAGAGAAHMAQSALSPIARATQTPAARKTGEWVGRAAPAAGAVAEDAYVSTVGP